jgi:uncharacterized RDD family membrane protein YckC
MDTAEQIARSYRSDIIVRRWVATWIDLFVVLVVLVFFDILLPAVSIGILGGLVCLHVIALAYHGFFEGQYGVTIGKWLSGIRVVDMNGNVPGLCKGFVRTLLRLVEINPLLFGGIPAGLTANFSKRRQRLGDMCAKTLVLKYSDLKRSFPESVPARIRGPFSNFLEWGIHR